MEYLWSMMVHDGKGWLDNPMRMDDNGYEWDNINGI